MNSMLDCILENITVFEEMKNGIIMIDDEGLVRYINHRALELLEIIAEDAIGKHILSVHKDSRLIETFQKQDIEKNVRIDINRRRCIATRLPIYSDKKAIGAMAIFDDVTSFEALNQKLEDDRGEMVILKSILELAYDGIIVVDVNGYITMISNAYMRFLGLENAGVIGKHVTEIIPNTRMHIVAETGIPEINDFQEIKGDYMVATRIPYYVDGKLAGAIGKVIFRNVSELNNINKKHLKIEQELRNLRSEISNIHRAKYTFNQIITSNVHMEKMKNQAKKMAYTKSTVLIQGESGTGKELFAHAIHQASYRNDMPFISMNCAAIPEQLLESELFGYDKGSFTGADKNGRIGKFELADQGTIFLDEIGDMPLQMQAKILRVIQEGEVERIGSNRPKQIDVRVIAATNKDLEQMVHEKTFREDLYYRLNVINFNIPPLRERKEDVILLSKHFIDQLNQQGHGKIKGISDKAKLLLTSYRWQGNIRELRNIIERAFNIMEGDDVIQPYHLPAFLKSNEQDYTGDPLKMLLEAQEKKIILERLIYFKGNKTKTADDLCISRMALHNKLEKFDLR